MKNNEVLNKRFNNTINIGVSIYSILIVISLYVIFRDLVYGLLEPQYLYTLYTIKSQTQLMNLNFNYVTLTMLFSLVIIILYFIYIVVFEHSKVLSKKISYYDSILNDLFLSKFSKNTIYLLVLLSLIIHFLLFIMVVFTDGEPKFENMHFLIIWAHGITTISSILLFIFQNKISNKIVENINIKYKDL